VFSVINKMCTSLQSS